MEATSKPAEPQAAAAETEEEIEEINVDVTEEGEVWLHGKDWELVLSPEEARILGESLLDAADDAEEATE